MNVRLSLAGLCLSVLLSACGTQTPYVYQDGEFDRTRSDFGHPITDRGEAIVCYAKNATSPAEIKNLAERACRAVGKQAVFDRHVESDCPLLTPSAARFACVTPARR